ncbi:MAG: NADH-quinone oxidoreductase subunit L [Sorangiineae bacterium]|nr:NADH-quinone oxidoreductase subunit L [Polyangiaceae bacterium]MEB2321559.1 NADH-quinone oxidoreductase subunit L [Sorangiineae bacterium]
MTVTPLTLALVALFTPLGAAALIGAVTPLRRRGTPAAWLSIAAVMVTLGCAARLFMLRLAQPDGELLRTFAWLPSGSSTLAELGVRLDGVSIPMFLVLSVVAACVQVFSLGYMADEPAPARGRYFAYHSLFVFSMGLLVLAPNLLELFIGWELVGLTSYLLIGFYYQKPSAAQAAIKAFWVTKFADMAFLLGLILLVSVTGSFSWTASPPAPWATAITLLVFVGVMGKSAQFPLHIWLPNAMEGPTPVSALLHAATMVAAGVYLIVRAHPLFALSETTLAVMTSIGAFTALFAAVIAVVQTDIKRVLAYSTCSQLGYMIAALGAGSVMGGYFHLTTHACFKALLFLGAGSVIHAVHSNELAHMGGLFRRMRLTGVTFMIGALALAGVPPFAGFFSKDLILEAMVHGERWLPLAALLAGAFLTALYMTRVVWLTFFGEPSTEHAEHAHEHGALMVAPLVVLAVLSAGAGFFGKTLAAVYGLEYEFSLTPVGVAGSALGLLGILAGWFAWGRPGKTTRAFELVAPLGTLARSGAVNRAWELGYRQVLMVAAELIAWFDRYVVDGVMNFIAWATLRLGTRLRRLTTGNAQDYVYAVVAGAVVIAAWGIFG